MRVPSDLAHLQTDDLVARLGRLTQKQIDGIAAIIAAGYTTEAIICPRHLLAGEDAICTETMFYRPGRWSEERQRWLISPGWSRQPAFIEALNLAKQLARRYNVDEEFVAVATANRIARLASPAIMQEMIRITRPTADTSPRDQVAAATLVLKHASLDALPDDDADNPEADWWKAAEEDA